MGLRQFTKATVIATPVQLEPTVGENDFQGLACVIHIEPRPANTGAVHVGLRSDMNPTGFVGIIAVLRPDSLTATINGLPELNIVDPSGMNRLDPSKIWIKPAVDNEGVLGYIQDA